MYRVRWYPVYFRWREGVTVQPRANLHDALGVMEARGKGFFFARAVRACV
jgi:hypothetical protein